MKQDPEYLQPILQDFPNRQRSTCKQCIYKEYFLLCAQPCCGLSLNETSFSDVRSHRPRHAKYAIEKLHWTPYLTFLECGSIESQSANSSLAGRTISDISLRHHVTPMLGRNASYINTTTEPTCYHCVFQYFGGVHENVWSCWSVSGTLCEAL